MALWGSKDYPNSNQKPVFANTTLVAGVWTNSSAINNTAANVVYGVVAGVSPTEQNVANSKPQNVAHAGWVSLKIGTGPVTAVSITSRGEGLNAAGYIVVTDGSELATGASLNISYTIANTQNTLQAYSSNSTWNGVGTLTIVNGGSGYSNATALTYAVSDAANITQPVLTFTLGGRAGRIQNEVLVAMGSITLDDPSDNAFYSGI